MKKSRLLLTILLFAACVLSTALLATSPTIHVNTITTESEVDSLIALAFSDYGISKAQYRVQTIAVDTAFSRKLYRIEVPSQFSKTSFHHRLQSMVSPFGIEVPAKVYFPDTDMNIHILYNDTIWRTLRLQTKDN